MGEKGIVYQPVIVGVDNSASMTLGERWKTACEVVPGFKLAMTNNPAIGESLLVGMVTFSEKAKEILPLSTLNELEKKSLDPKDYDVGPTGNATRLGTFIEAAQKMLDETYHQLVNDGISILRPLVLYSTDGEFNGESRDELLKLFEKLVDPTNPYHPNVVAIGVGDRVKKEDLLPFTAGKVADAPEGETPVYETGHEPYVFIVGEPDDTETVIAEKFASIANLLVNSVVNSMGSMAAIPTDRFEVVDPLPAELDDMEASFASMADIDEMMKAFSPELV